MKLLLVVLPSTTAEGDPITEHEQAQRLAAIKAHLASQYELGTEIHLQTMQMADDVARALTPEQGGATVFAEMWRHLREAFGWDDGKARRQAIAASQPKPKRRGTHAPISRVAGTRQT